MKQEILQQGALDCVRQVEDLIGKYPIVGFVNHLETIKSKIRLAKNSIPKIESSQHLVYDFFFPLCEQLDGFFYHQSYQRGLFGNCQLQKKIVSSLYFYWKYFDSLSFKEQRKNLKKEAFQENIIVCQRLYKRRTGKNVPTSVSSFLDELSTDFSAGMDYEQLCNRINLKIKKSSFDSKKFYSFLLKFFLHHPPLAGRSRKEVTVNHEQMYVDIWSSGNAPNAIILYLHGWHDSPDSAKLLAQLAINNNIEVHALHLPGHGLNYSTKYISIAELQSAFLNYYYHLLETINFPVIVAGHSMGGAILASCLNSISCEQLKQVVFFSPAFSAKQLDLLQEKMPFIHKNLNCIANEEKKHNLLHGGRGPVHPVLGLLSTIFSREGDNLYTLMQEGYRQFTSLQEMPAKIMLIYGKRDHCINYTVLESIERHAETVIRHAEFDHAPHLLPGYGGTLVAKSVLNKLRPGS